MRSKLRLTIGCFVTMFLHGTIIASPGAFLPNWKIVFGEELAIGLYYNLFLIGSLVGLRLASTNQKRHPLFALSFAIVGIGLSLVRIADNFQLVLLAALLMGLGDGFLTLQANSLVSELHPKSKIFVLSWLDATFSCGAIVTPLVSSFLPWRIIVALIATLAFIGIGLAWQAPDIANFSPKSDAMPWRKAFPFLILLMFYTGLEGTLGIWSRTYVLHLGWSETSSGALLSFYWGGLTLGRMTLGSLVSKRPVKALRSLLLSALLILGLSLNSSLAILIPLAAFFYGPLFAILFALVQERCGHVALGYLFYAGYIGNNTITSSFSLLEKHPSYLPYGFVFLALVLYLLGLRLKE